MEDLLKEKCNAIIREATNISNLAYLNDYEDKQWWLDYCDKLNELSIERKKL